MTDIRFPVIDPMATGENIVRLRKERGLTVKDLQRFFGFEEPRAIYKWQRGESLPTVDNLFALGALLGVPMEQILVPAEHVIHNNENEQRAAARCSLFLTGVSGCVRVSDCLRQFSDPFLPTGAERREQSDGVQFPLRLRPRVLRSGRTGSAKIEDIMAGSLPSVRKDLNGEVRGKERFGGRDVLSTERTVECALREIR